MTQRWLPWVWRVQTWLANYVPLLLMAALAALTWWLIKNTPLLAPAGEKLPPRHIPDYTMEGFELSRFDKSGQLRAQVLGKAMRHYPDTDTFELDGVTLRAHGNSGELTLVDAQRAESNGDGSELVLRGQVQVRRFERDAQGRLRPLPAMELHSEHLVAYVKQDRLVAEQRATLRLPGGELSLSRFDYQHRSGVLQFSGLTRGRIEAAARRGALKVSP
ncbi:LPS export ABC transporter periplasmic protein LptC [Roseateles sp. BYS180W]|uniref:LPS export ABC transporter periplasmic protein LptC n=1 Tax=Roseateles rivi TaxID=3299028 RepID=A0ABW7FUI9_9BURK